MSSLPFAVHDGGNPPLYRRKRVLFTLAASLFTLFLFLRTSSFTRSTRSATLKIDELNGLLYMVTNTEHILPHGLDTSAPLPHTVWVPREPYNSNLWSERIAKLDKTPVILFSKSYCP